LGGNLPIILGKPEGYRQSKNAKKEFEALIAKRSTGRKPIAASRLAPIVATALYAALLEGV
jgi:hypothetical protein